MKSLMPQIDSNDGLFHNGNPATGEQGTRVTDTWLNDVQDRVRDVQAEAHYVLQKAGFTPKAETQTQLYQAIVKIIDDNRKSASTTQKGEVRLTSDTGLDSEELGLTARAGKKLAQLIATVQLALNNYIPLNKRSSAVNSNDENNVATSKAVKTAYDKGVDAKNAADNAQRSANDGINRANNAQSSANAANNNANGRVSKSGDTMTGGLIVPFLNMIRDHAWGLIKSTNHQSAALDFTVWNGNNAQATIEALDIGNYGVELRFHTTPNGKNYEKDRRNHAASFNQNGEIWARAYGMLHDKFASKSDVYAKSRFRHQWYGNYYEGAEVFDVPMGDNGVMRTIIMGATIDGYTKLNLPESFNGTCRVQVMDVGSGRHVVGANIQNGNVVEVFNSGHTGLNIIAIGWYGW